ncbi:MAG: TadA family conjugal transfer-associated ATPase [Actinomycetales bacterium]|nr:TadA family conjugal transfer-associated ATPase [Actinomycetales bacterium]
MAEPPPFVARPVAREHREPAGPPPVPPTSRSPSDARSGAPPIPPLGREEHADPALEAGPLAPLLADPTVTDVFLNPDGSVWVDRGAGLVAEAGLRIPRDEAAELAVRLVSLGGRHLDEATPAVDVRLGTGRRVHAVLPPVSPGGPAVSIRLARREQLSLDDLVDAGTVTNRDAEHLRALVARRANLLVTGAGGSGKTTLLAALLAEVPPDERILVLEDVAELRIDHPHVVALEARQANLEGAGAVPLERLVREALRMRPDRLVVGECRGAELRELLAALNTGHDGGAGTLHANSLADVPARLEALGALAGLAPDALARQAISALDAVVHLERRGGLRRVVAIGEVVLDAAGRLAVRAGAGEERAA